MGDKKEVIPVFPKGDIMKMLLNDNWHITTVGKYSFDMTGDVPCTVYSRLVEEKLIDDPFYGENADKYTDISECDAVFEKTFTVSKEYLDAKKLLLKFNGIDTSAQIYLNGIVIGTADNMHKTYTYDVTDLISDEENTLRVYISSPIAYITERQEKERLWGVAQSIDGFSHMRKPPYMFGWDWGPKLPDMGIWRDVELIAVEGARIDNVCIRQDHSAYENEGCVRLGITTKLSHNYIADHICVTVEFPDGEASKTVQSIKGRKAYTVVAIQHPELWYPNGYGKQPLYKVTVEVFDTEDKVCDSYCAKVGLRTVKIIRDTVEDGRFFGVSVNGIRIFAMGANFVPEDQFITLTPLKKTKRLLQLCKRANYNMLRVWGGGIYQSNEFYDMCDEMGLLVWQDFMFACAVYKGDRESLENISTEVIQNVKRLRNHPCIALWCGNNEIESMWQYWSIDQPESYKKDYIRIFEVLIPKLMKRLDPDRFYHPSSPSSGGSFDNSGDITRGDQHYWEVWHSLRPFDDYLKYKFRFCSEYGFESLPSVKTISTFAERKDFNLMSPVMEAHQKCESGNEKLLYYMAQMVHYPYTFEGLVYASQTVQSDAIRLNVEHMRRNRQVCSGSLYWQVNDSNPIISWSSIDYYLRLKPLHYAARRFYAPVLMSSYEKDGNIAVNISSERQSSVRTVLNWNVRNADSSVITSGSKEIDVIPLHSQDYLELAPEDMMITDPRSQYVEFTLCNAVSGKVISSSVKMFVLPKQFSFADPKLTTKVTDEGDRYKITITSKAYAKGVWIEGKGQDFDPVFSDNFIDVHDTADIYLLKSHANGYNPAQLLKHLNITSYYSAMGLR